MAPYGDRDLSHAAPSKPPDSDDVLGSWKEIAVYLQRDLRTVMRWEQSRGLPVHRLPGGAKAAVFALKSELDAWRTAGSAGTRERPVLAGRDGGRRAAGEAGAGTLPNDSGGRSSRRKTGFLIAAPVLTAFALALATWYSRPPQRDHDTPIRSLAVLPFQNLNKDSTQDYFADGLHETLLTELARVGGIPVISRTSVERYRGERVPTKQIAHDLGVDALVEGSVLRVGNRVRITAQLVRGNTEEHVWANSYDHDLSDILDLLDRLAQDITAGIQNAVASTRPAADRGTLPRAVRPEALDAHLRGRYAMQSLTREGLEASLALQRQAVQLDPGFAAGWAALGATRTLQVFFAHVSPADAVPEARDASLRALALDPASGVAHASLGTIGLYTDWDFQTARNELERAIALSPNNTMARHLYADYLMITGKFDESLQQVRIAQVNDPFSPVARVVVLYHAFMARRYGEVESGAAELMKIQDLNLAHDVLARTLWVQGREIEALTEWKIAFRLTGANAARLDRACSTGGPRAGLLELARQRTASASADRQAGAVNEAGMLAAGGNGDDAFRWLDEAYSRREPFLLHVVGDPLFDGVRSDPRMAALLQRIGIDPTVGAVANTR